MNFLLSFLANLNKIKQNGIKTGTILLKKKNLERENGTWYWSHSVFCFLWLKKQNGIQIVNHSVNNHQNGSYIMYHSVFKLTEWHQFCLSLLYRSTGCKLYFSVHCQQSCTLYISLHCQQSCTLDISLHSQQSCTLYISLHSQQSCTLYISLHSQQSCTLYISLHSQQSCTLYISLHSQQFCTLIFSLWCQ